MLRAAGHFFGRCPEHWRQPLDRPRVNGCKTDVSTIAGWCLAIFLQLLVGIFLSCGFSLLCSFYHHGGSSIQVPNPSIMWLWGCQCPYHSFERVGAFISQRFRESRVIKSVGTYLEALWLINCIRGGCQSWSRQSADWMETKEEYANI